MNSEPVDLTQLIIMLQTLNEQDSRERQLAVMERRIVQAELDPLPFDFLDMARGVALLNQVGFENRKWLETSRDLRKFFSN